MTGNLPENVPGWVDSHCHIPGADAADLVAEAVAAGVTTMVTVGCDRASSLEALQVAAKYQEVHATVGLHPHEARHGVETIVDLFEQSPVAVGECGLDYHYDHSPRDDQRAAFAAQIAMANRLELPLVIHTREAWEDTFAILDAEGVPERTIFHCFTGGPRRGAPVRRPRRLRELLRDRRRSPALPRCARQRRSCRSSARSWRPTARTSPPSPTAVSATDRPGCPTSAPNSPRFTPSRSRRFEPPPAPRRSPRFAFAGRGS